MRPMLHPKRLLPALLALLPLAALADNPGSLIRNSELKAQPFIDAVVLASLPENTPLTVIANQGGWSQIKTNDGKTGWVRLLHIKLTKAEDAKSTGDTLGQIGGVIRTGTTKSAATTGAKGLNKEDIAKARPNPAEVQKLDTLKPRAGEIEQFAASHKLTPRNIPEL